MKEKETRFTPRHQNLRKLKLKTIGKVESPIAEPVNRDWNSVVSEIVVDGKWLKALKGLEDFSHIIVLFYFSKSKGIKLQTHPKGQTDLPMVGLFSTRSPRRPNPIAMTICRLVKRRGTRLLVKGLDAIHGTPVLDIKPYIPDNDTIKRPKVASWIKKLR